MEKKQYEVCLKTLNILDEVGVLNKVILVGSWCIPFYKKYFKKVRYIPTIKTRDMDLLVPAPSKISKVVNLPVILKDLGFVVGFTGSQGYMRLEHPQLLIEFLVPERGRGTNKPHPLPQLGVNAQALRYLNFLTNNTLCVKIEGITIIVPHPVNFALHKLIISQLRKNKDKIVKDREAAVNILRALVKNKETNTITQVYSSIPPKWKKRILKGLEKAEYPELAAVLK